MKDDKVVYEAEADAGQLALADLPFSNDPVIAHAFLHILYNSMGVEQPKAATFFERFD